MNTPIKTTESTVNNSATVQTMSSREIAELCGKRHDHVRRDIKQMLEELYSKRDIPKFGDIYLDARSRSQHCYHLPKRECLVLVSGYSTALRAKIIDCWQALEAQVAAPCIDYSSPEVVLGVLTYLKNENERKDNVIAELQPKAKALESLKRSDGLFGIIEAAKVLEMRPKDFIHYLWSHNWVYRRVPGAPLLPYQDKIKKGLMDCSTLTIHKPDGIEKIVSSAKITADGLASLREQFHGGVQ
ncbi:phage antirepressor KilAC domain-containing protein [Bartonella ancashensis]|uniref:Anti-repressor protein n=1 Tax=Bartonella ancashensis TaxID=1318743 RepID=A0A0M5KSJ4_9HYPH|nr:phage regulatory protein/antirepressor Ant [Bartonella ancashensis]ALE03440.1 Anti-repressor protein [Bartonella ancashensis]